MSKILWSIESGVPGVRLAVERDETDIFALLLMLHAEIGLFTLNRDKLLDGIRYATQRRGGIIFVINEGSRVVATLGMTVACEWYSDDEYLLERWNFVHPDYRKSDYARRLLETGKWASEWYKLQAKRNVPFFCGINSLKRTEGKIRLYARHMVCLGGFFMYGMPMRQADEVAEEMRRIDEQTRVSNRKDTLTVRPAVETLIRVSQEQEREREHVRQ